MTTFPLTKSISQRAKDVNHAVKHPQKLPLCQSFHQQARLANWPATLPTNRAAADPTEPIVQPRCHRMKQPLTRPVSQPASRPIHRLPSPDSSRLFSQPVTHFPHEENMLHFHLMRCVEVSSEQSQRREMCHLTLPCSLSNTHYFVLSESFFSIALSSVFLILHPLLCV